MKKIKRVQDFIKEYFEKNHSKLDGDYPGIRYERFLEEYCTFDSSKPDDKFIMENPAFFEKIKLGVPLEYINFQSYFYTNEFYVNPHVLIPRSETEILVEKAIEFINKNSKETLSIYDIGTGSGIIPLTIAAEVKKPLHIRAGDISKEALDVAYVNYENLLSKFAKGTSVQFEIRDRMTGLDEKFDLILSNPPYIKEVADKSGVHHQANAYEPHMALYLKDEEYDNWFSEFFTMVAKNLNSDGLFIMEGHEDHLALQAQMLSQSLPHVRILQDYTHRDRFLVAHF